MSFARPRPLARILTLLLCLFAVVPGAKAQGELELRGELQRLLAGDEIRAIQAVDVARLRRFYAIAGDRPVWGPDAEGELRAVQLLEAVLDARRHGIDPDRFARLLQPRVATPPLRAASWREVRLSEIALRFAAELHAGAIDPRRLDREREVARAEFDPAASLAAAIRERDVAGWLAALPPPHPEYAALLAALARYEAILGRGGWRAIAFDGDELRLEPGDARLEILRERLAIDGDLAAGGGGPGEIAAAVRRFQARHGLAADGRLTRRTLAAMNVPVEQRIAQVTINLERWRWLPRDFGPRYIFANSAAATITAVTPGQKPLELRGVVGSPDNPTPDLGARVRGLVINPPWNVPMSIASKEILPKLKRNPRYLAANDMVILNGGGDPHGADVDWQNITPGRFPYLIQQRPGVRNPLGMIKLDMPNRFDVYLHDTNQRSLFARAARALSHGCVRVEDAMALGAWLRDEPREAVERVHADALRSRETRRLALKESVPVWIVYLTAFVDGAGQMNFRDDIYGRDQRLLAAWTRR
jgi:murein L,D-transpeptidase YcbB/YkuD